MFTSPAIAALAEIIRPELVWAQVLIQRHPAGFELRHVADREVDAAELRVLEEEQVRDWVQVNAKGAFRPLKSAPDLRPGWRVHAGDAPALEAALNHLYPGSVADWFAARSSPPPVTSYRDFTARQTGMYRITQMLDDGQAAAMAAACCQASFCLKRRLWTVGELRADPAETKSHVPCLEPCAVLLEFARKAVRIEQEPKVEIRLANAEWDSISAALEVAMAQSDGGTREADFAAPLNRRRLALLRAKLQAIPREKASRSSE